MSGDGNSFIMSYWGDQHSTKIQTGIVNAFSYNSATSVWDNVLTAIGDNVSAGRLGWSVHISYNADFIAAIASVKPSNSKFFRKVNGSYVETSSESGFPTKTNANSVLVGTSISADGKCVAWVDNQDNQIEVYSYNASTASWSQKGTGIVNNVPYQNGATEYTYLDTTGSKVVVIYKENIETTPYALIKTYAYDGTNWNQLGSDISKNDWIAATNTPINVTTILSALPKPP